MTTIGFEYPEDREFFANLLAGGDTDKLDAEFSDLFDFRHTAIKRWEFNKVRKQILRELIEKYHGECQLRLHPDCDGGKGFQPDHVIPLSSNDLNKKLRGLTGKLGKKAESQSFGSNHPRNLTLACKRCNAFKKHKVLAVNLSGK